ncbi:hypothetical protein K6119_07095 [Paracrocinitomix mangrovi]|uniref:hypothetical protein n=1 Tax=Paracrocinitomix mangrovi TaxID=2862509 RepID=UPI001C8E13F5|nr:hypothetical protein [Paracrocinitomix mangrovi]UKN03278.1 hypothetical protein K6119_07095 [Paracrocinitomix mangrovi]
MKNSYFVVLIALVICNSISYSQEVLKIETISSRHVTFSFVNQKKEDIYYFNPDVYFYGFYRTTKQKSKIVHIFNDRAILFSDTLQFYLHHFDFWDSIPGSNPNFENRKMDGMWKFNKLSPGQKSNTWKIKFNCKIPYKTMILIFSYKEKNIVHWIKLSIDKRILSKSTIQKEIKPFYYRDHLNDRNLDYYGSEGFGCE